MSKKIPVGISTCLLGERVRFDGGHKRSVFAAEELAPYLHCESICPEMAIGLPAPRPALRLTQGEEGVGIFTRELMAQLPWLPVEEDGRLHDPILRENFVARVYALHEFNQLWAGGLTRAKLMDFHSRYKLLLLAHSQPKYREIGPFVAKMDRWESLDEFALAYRQLLMDLMKQPASRSNHTNVLMHVQGYFRRELNSPQRQELATLIDSYRRGIQPLLAPITLLKHYMAQYPHPWLTGQRYFSPYPEALRLRYGY